MAQEMGESSVALRSKQARIRDNQRRSRARRQEHLADLEKRLADCHVVCREADMQREAFKELQAENLRLRELLTLVGVNPSLVDTYVYQNDAQDQHTTAALRQLRPKIPLECRANVMSPTSDVKTVLPSPVNPPWPQTIPQYLLPSHVTFAPPSTVCAPSLNGGCCGSNEGSTPADQPFVLSHVDASPISPLEAELDEPFFCDSFHVKTQGPLLDSGENTVLCSQAKEMIEQFNIDDRDLEEIKSRLAAGFAKATYPGAGCRVSNQLLFDILNEISSVLC